MSELKQTKFKIHRTILKLFLFILAVSLMQLGIFLMNYEDAKIIHNLMKAYSVTNDYFSGHYLMYTSFLSTVLWNNTLNYYGKEGSRTTYE